MNVLKQMLMKYFKYEKTKKKYQINLECNNTDIQFIINLKPNQNSNKVINNL